MFDGWQKIEVTEKDTAVLAAQQSLLEATDKWIASNGASVEAAVLSDRVGVFVAELLAASNIRVHWTLRLWAWLKNLVNLGLRQ